MKRKETKKVVIVGAGVSGMTAGIYALDNGFDVEIYEKHLVPGGQCTGWTRDGVFIDGCAHWIVGTNPKSDLNPLWRHIGAINDDTKIYRTEYFSKFDMGDGEIVTLYADLKQLEDELNAHFPEDRKIIKHLIGWIKAYRNVKIPVVKPIDWMNPFEITGFGAHFIPMLGAYTLSRKVDMHDYTKKAKSEKLKDLLNRIIYDGYNLHSLLYIMQSLSKDDAGVIEGGSKALAERVADTFKAKGGKLFLNSPVKKIIVEDNAAKGILLESGDKVAADYVIAAGDVHNTLFSLLDSKYTDKYYLERFIDRKKYPLNACMFFAFKVTKNIDDYPKMIDFRIKPITVGKFTIDRLSVRNHAFDKTLNQNATSVNALVYADDSVYNYFKPMDKKAYREEKLRIGELVRSEARDYMGLKDEEIKLIDVTTPLTYERYCNAFRGSYMSFITTKHSKGLMRKGLLKGLKNFVIAGQWIMPPGGLPIALFSGKHAAMRVCKMNHQRFVCKESKR